MFVPPESGACCDGCCGCCSNGLVCHPCEAGVGGSGGSCATCCHGVSVAGAEDACVLCALGLFALLAVVGVFVCLIAGAYLLNTLVQRHVHVLQKWTRTQRQMVADLADQDDGALFDDGDEEIEEVEDLGKTGPTAPLVQSSRAAYRSLEVHKGVFNA